MTRTAALLFSLIPCIATASDQSPYAGEESRPIKSLSGSEIESLQKGDGMGFAKLAELNHFPGPRHVLDLAEELGLSPRQLAETRALYERMRREAVILGEKLVQAESRLDQSFALGEISPESLEAALSEIGQLRAKLRYVHLNAHLSQAELLSQEQIEKYDAVRGYGTTSHDHSEHSSTHD